MTPLDEEVANEEWCDEKRVQLSTVYYYSVFRFSSSLILWHSHPLHPSSRLQFSASLFLTVNRNCLLRVPSRQELTQLSREQERHTEYVSYTRPNFKNSTRSTTKTREFLFLGVSSCRSTEPLEHHSFLWLSLPLIAKPRGIRVIIYVSSSSQSSAHHDQQQKHHPPVTFSKGK